MDPVTFRAQFPVLERLAYLNAGTCGPLPAPAIAVATKILEECARSGRGAMYYEQSKALATQRRAAYGSLINAQPTDIALTTSTSDGLVRVLAGLDLQPGDEVLTSTDEHPGLYGPLSAARAQRAISVRSVPFAALADSVTRETRLVATSHVNWIDGRTAPDFSGFDVPVLLDGAQGVGAVAVDVTTALRAGRHRPAVGRAGVDRAPTRGRPHVYQPRGRERGPRRRAGGRRGAP